MSETKEYKIPFTVRVSCLTFNHAPYIVDAMNGFTMQQTDFPFVCTIIDDASTDGEPEVIKKYLQDHFDMEDKAIVRNEETDDYVMSFARHKTNNNCFFAVYYLKYNHYSIKKIKMTYIQEWTDTKYIAICEGDDYWIDPQKLKKQVDYLDNHSKCTMTCCRARLYSEKKKKIVGEQYCRKSDGLLNPVDIINRTGLYIPTCSLVYKPQIKEDYPDYCQNCNVGDYPLQITAAMKGDVYYFNKSMSVYRIQLKGSWSSRQKFHSIDPNRLHIVRSQAEMFKGFSIAYPHYKSVFSDKIAEHIIKNMPTADKRNEIPVYFDAFNDYTKDFSLKWRLVLFVFHCFTYRIPILKAHRFLRGKMLGEYMPLKYIYKNG